MKSFIKKKPAKLNDNKLVEWLSAPGRLGDHALGDPLDGDVEYGEFEPDPPEDPPPKNWDQRVSHCASAAVDAESGRIDQLFYHLYENRPTDLPPKNTPPSRVDTLFAALAAERKQRFGKPGRRTKNQLEWQWPDGGARISRDASTYEPWEVLSLEVAWWGSEPPKDTLGSERAGEPVKRPSAKAVKDEINSAVNDCFDCRMRVTKVSVKGKEPPYKVIVTVKFDPDTGEDVEEGFSLIVDDSSFDISAAAIEAMGELVDEYRD